MSEAVEMIRECVEENLFEFAGVTVAPLVGGALVTIRSDSFLQSDALLWNKELKHGLFAIVADLKFSHDLGIRMLGAPCMWIRRPRGKPPGKKEKDRLAWEATGQVIETGITTKLILPVNQGQRNLSHFAPGKMFTEPFLSKDRIEGTGPCV